MSAKKYINIVTQKMQLAQYWEEIKDSENVQDNRERRNVMFRHAFMVSARQNSVLSLNEVASVMNKNHATVIHAQRQHDSNLRFDDLYRYAFSRIDGAMREMFMEDIEVGAYDGLKGENKALRKRIAELNKKNRQYIHENVTLKESVDELKESVEQLRLESQVKDKRIQTLNRKLSSIAW
jgi:FtsZ-binding cell division protein ZapB